jgi:ABC-2 type transport system permease protein
VKTPLIAKYAAFARIAAAQARRERADLYGRMAFFVVILGVFSSLWRAVAEAGMPIAADAKALVWYLAATEWILLSAPPIYLEIQEAIRRGDFVYRLAHPVSFVLAEFASGLGLLALRAPVLGITACCCAFAFTGWVPSLSTLALFVPFGVAASLLLTALYVPLGLLAFWLHDVSPVFWVWLKLLFVLGGLMLPRELYPQVIQRVALVTPFPSLLAGPASFVLGAGDMTPEVLARHLFIWSCTTALATTWLFRHALSGVTINGG